MTAPTLGNVYLKVSTNGALLCFGTGYLKHCDHGIGLGFQWSVDKTNSFWIMPDYPRKQEFFDLHAVEIERMVREAIHQIAAKITKVAQK